MLFCVFAAITALGPLNYSSDATVCAGCHMETMAEWAGPNVSKLPLVWKPLANDPAHSCLVDKAPN